MRGDLAGIVLLLFATTVLRLAFSDAYLLYVKESLRPYLIVSGGALAVLALWLIVDVVRHAPRGVMSLSGDDGHGHGRAQRSAVWLLVLPVLTIYLVAPPALGAFTADRAPSVVTPPADDDWPALPPGDPVDLALTDYAVRAVWGHGTSLQDRTVRVSGFVTARKDGRWFLTRLSLTCCAADAIVTKVLAVEPPSDPPQDTWLSVTGTWVSNGKEASEQSIPWLKVDRMTEIPEPKNPYE